MVTSSLLLVGNWVRYAGTKAQGGGMFGVVMFGQVLIGLAQPFCLTAPTRYSDLWFSDQGRTSATAVATLANPLGAALGQLINSFWASEPSQIPDLVLWIAVMGVKGNYRIHSLILHPLPPANPRQRLLPNQQTPAPPSPNANAPTPEFWLILTPFGVYVGFFNSVSSLLTQILSPYGFSETQAGIAGGILIIVGLLSSAILSPFIDRSKHYLGTIRVLVPLVGIAYIALVFAPSSPAGIAPSYVICALLGASSFALLPVVLEYLVEITYPFSPEIGTTMCWALGQFLGAVFVLVQDALKASGSGDPPQNMRHALVFSAVVACVAAPFPMCIGLFGRRVSRRRLDVDRGLDLDGQSQLAVVQVVRCVD
ncbi:hypothetical protein ARAM_005689 [Aspergillus rambellii]|uniref:Cell surface receptor/MFS transporter (FLVCR) n=1 Tax=Aspergillus rambellii TaxID=308745 RepID=A0A0F8V083_9EURO|nr:hypothetical protein ARAM_005689 [Aspergillus rambellii]